MNKRHRLLRSSLIMTLITALILQFGVDPALAQPTTDPPVPTDESSGGGLSPRAKVLTIWRSGGELVKAEAAKALTGSDADVDTFLKVRVAQLAATDNRIAVNQILTAGGPTVQNRAQKALDAADGDANALRAFLDTGWSSASDTDLRIRVNQIMTAGGPEVQKAAQKALDAETPAALKDFLRVTSVRAEALDLRIRVNQIMTAGGPEVQKAAQTALDAETPEALRLFVSREWEVAESRDQETASITQLVAAAKAAGTQAAQETQAAKDSADKALAEADLARQATELAAQAAEAAQHNAAGAAEAAGRAASAANRAAAAAVTAIGAANAASSAARVAANAAARAAAAATKAGRASSTAWGFAAAARGDRNRVGDAKKAALEAAAASTGAKEAIQALDLAKVALDHARDAIGAATSAGDNATRSANAAQESVRWAKAAGADASKAEAAAATARRQADLARRAAGSARAYADEAASAAATARDLASRAAIDAEIAAAAANDAAEHASDSQHAAQQATDNANSATASAKIAIDSAAQAQRLYNAARKADEDRIALQADQATEAARQTLEVNDQLRLTRNWNAAQETQRDAETTQWLAAAAAPGADPALVVANGRKIAMRLLTTGGSWTAAAAETALSGADPEVQEFVRAGIAQAATLDDRETLQQLIANGNDALRKAGEAALAGNDTDVKRFLQTPQYPKQDLDLRISVNQVLSAANSAGDVLVAATAQKALDAETADAYRTFLNTGQNVAREKDDRIAINQLISNPATGPEARLLGQAALEGSPNLIRQYRDAGQYIATRHDREAAAHNAAVAGLVAQVTSVAATASQDAATAQSVAATARNAANEAADYASRARAFATDAATSAQSARQSAEQAQQSAVQAAQSAETARQASLRASQSAVRATQSAASARHSASIASSYAQSALQAAHQAYQDAVDAGRDAKDAVDAANNARTLAITRAEKEIADAKAQFATDVNKQCEGVPAGPDRDDCVSRATRMIADPKGESERNVAVCNQLKQYNEEAFNNCLQGAYNPSLNYQINKAISDAKQKAQDEQDADRWWSIAGTVIAGAVIVGAGIFCAEVCTAPLLGALVGAEAGFLAEAAGAGIGLTIGAEFVTGVAADSLLAARIGALSEIDFLGGIAVRNGLGNLELQFTKLAADCNSFTPETNVLLSDGTRRAIKDITVGDSVVATDPTTSETRPEPVTDLISTVGEKNLVDVRVHRSGTGSDVVTATAHHPFWVSSKNDWVNAESLTAGDQLRQPDGTVATVDGTVEHTERRRVHNLTVEDLHSYYVLAGDTAVLVHNSTCLQFFKSLSVAQAANPILESLRATQKLPAEFITKKEARDLYGWQEGRALGTKAPGKQIGGDIWRNELNEVPAAPGRIWWEADVGLNSAVSRSKQEGWRLLYSNDGLAYVTFDHYVDRELLYQLPNWK